MPLATGSHPHSSITTQNHLFRPIEERENFGNSNVFIMMLHPCSVVILWLPVTITGSFARSFFAKWRSSPWGIKQSNRPHA